MVGERAGAECQYNHGAARGARVPRAGRCRRLRRELEGSGAKFRLDITPDRWAQAAKGVRAPLGALTRRSMLKTTFTRSFPGVPEGDYALVLFRTSFERKADGDETVTLERESDGRWRVIGYVVR
jgi:hypothetical protein